MSPGIDERDFGDIGDGPDVIRGRRVLGSEDGRHAQLQKLAGLSLGFETERKSQQFESLASKPQGQSAVKGSEVLESNPIMLHTIVDIILNFLLQL